MCRQEQFNSGSVPATSKKVWYLNFTSQLPIVLTTISNLSVTYLFPLSQSQEV
jgi:hypothetical protein